MFRRKWFYFTRRRISFFVIPSLFISVIFILYQISIFLQISNEYKVKDKPNLFRGIHEQQNSFYVPQHENKFICIRSFEEIDFKKINDNYCDCLDGSDEPGTNACPNGIFYCTSQVATKRFSKSVPSSKVNDGICDCCDGSDEWENNQVLKNMDRIFQIKADRYHVPCPKMC